MDTSKILMILCCFILIVCLTLCISTLVVLRNAIDEHGEVQSSAEALVGALDECLSDLTESTDKDDSISASADANKSNAEKMRFVVRELDGKIGIYTADGQLLKKIDVSVSLFPKADREALAKGIEVGSWQELITLIQDYTG